MLLAPAPVIRRMASHDIKSVGVDDDDDDDDDDRQVGMV